MNQGVLFFCLVLLIFILLTGISNWLVSRNPLRFDFSGRHDIVCYSIFLSFSLLASGITVLFYNLYIYFFT
ncbi:MAG: hypothetical protein A3J76_04895 [Candidatus Moranbacteria bacterium RBG_13_45_13]|nr:MAG: hypothetical protein A3J76_04895 [Candidatus Moranbacteria bacterium RBG_13_45_13]